MEIKYLVGAEKLNEMEKSYLEKKAQKTKKLLGANEGNLLRAELEVAKDKSGFWNIVISVVIPRDTFRVEKRNKDMRKAVDFAEEALLKMIRRNKEKVRDSLRKRGKVAEVIVNG